jgi:very-short-patch-repair endonuclease
MKYNWNEIQKFYNLGNTFSDITDKFGCCRGSITKAVKRGDFISRSQSESMKIWRKKNPQKTTEETKKKISEAMKKAHAEGRAWNIGKSRWNNTPSYPEQFFMKVIENEFEDKDYENELPFHRFSLDFAWIHKKRVIEIDGSQHERFQEYKERDEKKDELLKSEGWEVLRIQWKDMFHNTKVWTKHAKDFIDKGEVKISKEDYYEEKKNKCVDCGIEIWKESKRCNDCQHLTRRKVERPPIEQIIKEVEETSYCEVSRKYGVSDNAIRKWITTSGLEPPRFRKQK